MARKPSPLQRLHDIPDAIDKIDRWYYAATRGVADPIRASMLYDAVVRNIEVVSEAARHFPPDLTAKFPNIPWRAIAGIGKILCHGYDNIRDDIIWRTVEDDLPPLKNAIVEMIERLESSST